jgi:Ca2+-dependent lipid-binding protein
MAKTTTGKESKTGNKSVAPAKAKAGQKAAAVISANEKASKIDNVLIVPESAATTNVAAEEANSAAGADAAAQEAKQEAVTIEASLPSTTTASDQAHDTKGNTNYCSLNVTDDDIAVMAYFLWEKEGYVHGRDGEYWFRAEELLRNQLASKLTKY